MTFLFVYCRNRIPLGAAHGNPLGRLAACQAKNDPD